MFQMLRQDTRTLRRLFLSLQIPRGNIERHPVIAVGAAREAAGAVKEALAAAAAVVDHLGVDGAVHAEAEIPSHVREKSGAICKIHAKYSARAARSLAMQIRKSHPESHLSINISINM